MHITLHALSLLVVLQCVTVTNIISALQVAKPEQNTALNAMDVGRIFSREFFLKFSRGGQKL